MVSAGLILLDALIFFSDLANAGSYVIILAFVSQKRSVAGLSLQSFFCLVATRIQHIFSHSLDLHYLPQFLFPSLYHLLDLCACVLGLACVAVITTKYMHTYDASADDFGLDAAQAAFKKRSNMSARSSNEDKPVPAWAKWSFMYIVAVVVSFLWYQVRRMSTRSMASFWTGYFCCFYEVICSIALLPQLWMFQKEKRANALLGNFVICIAVNRFCILLFWFLYPTMNYGRRPDNRGIQMASESLNLLIAADFIYYYARSKLRGDKGDIILGSFVDDV
jgi:hypothetical protein